MKRVNYALICLLAFTLSVVITFIAYRRAEGIFATDILIWWQLAMLFFIFFSSSYLYMLSFLFRLSPHQFVYRKGDNQVIVENNSNKVVYYRNLPEGCEVRQLWQEVCVPQCAGFLNGVYIERGMKIIVKLRNLTTQQCLELGAFGDVRIRGFVFDAIYAYAMDMNRFCNPNDLRRQQEFCDIVVAFIKASLPVLAKVKVRAKIEF